MNPSKPIKFTLPPWTKNLCSSSCQLLPLQLLLLLPPYDTNYFHLQPTKGQADCHGQQSIHLHYTSSHSTTPKPIKKSQLVWGQKGNLWYNQHSQSNSQADMLRSADIENRTRNNPTIINFLLLASIFHIRKWLLPQNSAAPPFCRHLWPMEHKQCNSRNRMVRMFYKNGCQ